jgi:hypothetical protein
MKDYLTAAKAKGLNGDGFRIYIVKKPKFLPDREQDVISMVFVPTTYTTEPKVHYDYYDCFNFKKIDFKKEMNEPNDNGEECPTFCNEGTTWDTLKLKLPPLKKIK